MPDKATYILFGRILGHTGPEIKTKLCTTKIISASTTLIKKSRFRIAIERMPSKPVDQLDEIFLPRGWVIEADTRAETETGGRLVRG